MSALVRSTGALIDQLRASEVWATRLRLPPAIQDAVGTISAACRGACRHEARALATELSASGPRSVAVDRAGRDVLLITRWTRFRPLDDARASDTSLQWRGNEFLRSLNQPAGGYTRAQSLSGRSLPRSAGSLALGLPYPGTLLLRPACSRWSAGGTAHRGRRRTCMRQSRVPVLAFLLLLRIVQDYIWVPAPDSARR